MGQFAFRKLLNVMKDNEITESSTILPFELVVRESCGHLL